MIPKIIHWCWLSGDDYPPFILDCMETWAKLLPDYEIKCWTAKDFNIHSVRFVEEAYNAKKWASASDYIRLYALYNYGGIYLDSDVRVLKTFDSLLDYNFFSGLEIHDKYFKLYNLDDYIDNEGTLLKNETFNVPGIGIQAAIIGSSKGNIVIKDMMKYYETNSFSKDYYDGVLSAPVIVSRYLYNYGFRYKNETQSFNNNIVFKSNVFPHSMEISPETIAVHCGMGSWVFNKSFKHKVAYYMKTHKWTYTLFKLLKFRNLK